MVASTAKVGAWIALGGSLALGGLVVRHLTEADLHRLIETAHAGDVEQLKQHLVDEAEAAAEAEKQALLETAERAAAAAVDAAAEELKAQVDQAAEDAKARVHQKLMGEDDAEPPERPSDPVPTASEPPSADPPADSDRSGPSSGSSARGNGASVSTGEGAPEPSEGLKPAD